MDSLAGALKWLAARLREPSTYAGIAGLLASIGLTVDPGMLKSFTLAGTGLGGLLAFIIPEKK